jgi:hypothetical protein
MPNTINPNDYNIDKFDSGFLGPITDSNFLNFLVSHNLNEINPVVASNLNITLQSRGREYDVSQSTFNVTDVPNLQTVANTPSVYNNLSNPREVNLSRNLQNISDNVSSFYPGTPTDQGRGQDAATIISDTSNDSISDLPNVLDISNQSSSVYTNGIRNYNLDKNPSLNELTTWYPNYAYWFNFENDTYKGIYTNQATLKLSYVGDVENYVFDNGMVTTTHDIRDLDYYKIRNKYGPETLVRYSNSREESKPYDNSENNKISGFFKNLIPTFAGSNTKGAILYNPTNEIVSLDTGFKEYKDSVKPDLLRDVILNRNLGVGPVPFSTLLSGINFKHDGENQSELERVGKQRRGVEILNRIRTNFTDNVLGAYGASKLLETPASVAANVKNGGLKDLFTVNPDYTITPIGVLNNVPLLGKVDKFAARFLGGSSSVGLATDLLGINIPFSTLNDGAFPWQNREFNESNYRTEIDIPLFISNETGLGQKKALNKALEKNKYTPNGRTNDALTEKDTYLTVDKTSRKENSKSVINIDKLTEEGYQNDSNNQNGFYGIFETTNDKSFSSEFEFSKLENESDYYDSSKASTRYEGTQVEQKYLTYDHSGTVNEKFDWRNGRNTLPRKGLLRFTQQLINNAELNTKAGYIGYFDSAKAFNGKKDYKQSVDKHGHHVGSKIADSGSPAFPSTPILPSKGNVTRNVKLTETNGSTKKDGNSGEYYCRSWSSRRKYHTWENLVRSGGNWWRGNIDKDDLTLNWDGKHDGDFLGQPKIAWTSNDNPIIPTPVAPEFRKQWIANQKLESLVRPYMLSIENLAWKGAPHLQELPLCEKGPNGGRIMWFPPYDINFTDNSSVTWDSTPFIGRGENVYTYNNTERSGTLDFTLIVDHPDILNKLKKDFKEETLDELYHSYFAGCDEETIKNIFGKTIEMFSTPQGSSTLIKKDVPDIKSTTPADPPTNDVRIYFENARGGVKSTEKDSKGRTIGLDVDLDTYEVTTFETADYLGKYLNNTEWNTNSTKYPCGPAGNDSFVYLNKYTEKELKNLAKWLVTTEDGKNYKIKIYGSASIAKPDTNSTNTELAQKRSEKTKEYLYKLMLSAETEYSYGYPWQGVVLGASKIEGATTKNYPLENDPEYLRFRFETNNPGDVTTLPETGNDYGVNWSSLSSTENFNKANKGEETPGINPCLDNVSENLGNKNSPLSKLTRYSRIYLEKDTTYQVKLLNELNKELKKNSNTEYQEELKKIEEKEKRKEEEFKEKMSNFFVSECEAFDVMKKDNPFIYNSLAEKIKFFHPAFHSQTPEGFNSRLTFLKQCTRQGPQIIDSESPSNMVFGRPPVCVLRIGDFYHTKIIIDSINLTYEPLQWDLNPEGIGVQPMIAKVSIGFKFIGGSSLGGPITQLQNAVSYNFFANTAVYNQASVKTTAEEILGKKRSFIYGAFRSPQNEKDLLKDLDTKIEMADKKAKEEAEQTVNTTTQTTNAENTNEVKNEIQNNMPKSEVNTSSPLTGNKLQDVLNFLQLSSSASGFYEVSLPSGKTISKKGSNPEPNPQFGFALGVKQYVKNNLGSFMMVEYLNFLENGKCYIMLVKVDGSTLKWKPGFDIKTIDTGIYYNFGSLQDGKVPTIEWKNGSAGTKNVKKWSAQNLTGLLSNYKPKRETSPAGITINCPNCIV